MVFAWDCYGAGDLIGYCMGPYGAGDLIGYYMGLNGAGDLLLHGTYMEQVI